MTSLYETAVAQAQRSLDQLRDDTDRAAQEASMLCNYCTLPLTDPEKPSGLHPICASEVSDAPLTSCPDGGCEACEPPLPGPTHRKELS